MSSTHIDDTTEYPVEHVSQVLAATQIAQLAGSQSTHDSKPETVYLY